MKNQPPEIVELSSIIGRSPADNMREAINYLEAALTVTYRNEDHRIRDIDNATRHLQAARDTLVNAEIERRIPQ